MKPKTVLGVTVLIAGFVVLLGVGGGLFATDDVAENVTIEPHPNNGQYVVSAGADQVAIDVTAGNENLSAAINDEALTRVDDVVLLTNDRSSSISVWTEDAVDDVTFYRSTSGRPSLEGSGNAVTLAAGETLAVGFEIDTRGSDSVESLQEVTFNVADDTSTATPTETATETETADSTPGPSDPYPYVRVDDVDDGLLNATVVGIEDGEAFTIDADNTGYDPLTGTGDLAIDSVALESDRDADVEFDLSAASGLPDDLGLSADAFHSETGAEPLGTVAVSQDSPADGVAWMESGITVDADVADREDLRLYRVENGTLSFADSVYEGEDGDRHAYTVRSSNSTQLVVAVDRPSIAVSRASLNRTSVSVGGAVNVSATLRNDGARQGDYVADLSVDGRVLRSRAVTVPADSRESIHFQQRFGAEGSYGIRVESVTAGTVTVTNESAVVNVTATTESSPGAGPGAGPGVGPGPAGPGEPSGGPSGPSTTTPTPSPEPVPLTTESEESGVFDLSDITGPAALALSGMVLFVVLGLLYYVSRRLRDDEDEPGEDVGQVDGTDESVARDGGEAVGEGGDGSDAGRADDA
ncbi:hypothetical protein [Halorientalis halophila]|uniref:hypothetical protein n=1 Tax=Halorientalis halophila TaxID=3108499 RepID=UPI0030086388